MSFPHAAGSTSVKGNRRRGGAMTDVTIAAIDDMESIHDGMVRRARATLGVTAWGMQVLTLPPNWDGYPNHNHDGDAFDPNQEEVYVPLEGSAVLEADGEGFALRPGIMARVGPGQLRRIVPGPEGIRFLALGGAPGSFSPPAWSELGAPPPAVE
jgi:mannose-6-phosphate isomerase-like protein (cupin superfamily)